MAVEDKEKLEKVEASEAVIALQPPILKPALYINRELSLLEFNARVLEEALDERNPLLERLQFLARFNLNLDEFFMIRTSGIREEVKAGVSDRSPDGMTPGEEMLAMRARMLPLLETQSAFFLDKLRPALARQGIKIAKYDDLQFEELTPEQKRGSKRKNAPALLRTATARRFAHDCGPRGRQRVRPCAACLR